MLSHQLNNPMSMVEESLHCLLGLKPSMPTLRIPALALVIGDQLDLYLEGETNTMLDRV
jgi:hypothetical protein